ncbi:putative phosphomannomutase [Clavibacter michiganensis subsp. michiganensis]|uniref:Putative phosphomannomutase n=1 Tax=Clavibacter michiganensis subsp. michiganensis TaxID=33013 RepID=A0A251XD93_CLAMM|nr:putative phosphomannomutase [Clavibacter michiganensis subsp. michiganensis]OUE00026.1 putative phosphomannomutase [Clavibacter michiganensis subsp. michiganensis]
MQQLPVADDYEIAPETLIDSYVEETAELFAAPLAPLRWVYTPLHGVGWETAARVFDAVGVDAPVVVAAQADPDPDFPTVDFPNPEEPGALDLAFEAAVRSDAELIIANDPDADRLAVAIADEHGAWRRLSGNEVGMLLGLGIAERYAADGNTGTFASSLVSSPRSRSSPGSWASATARRSRASSGSAACRISSTATRRRSATWSRPGSRATRTASPPPSPCSTA